MRFDKLTTKFQQALADAQSLAARNDHPYICLLYTSFGSIGAGLALDARRKFD